MPDIPNSLTDRLTPAGERPKGGKQPETEERKQPVGLAQRQRRESSLWNWPRGRGEKAARGQPEERKQPVCKSSNYLPTCAFGKFIREVGIILLQLCIYSPDAR